MTRDERGAVFVSGGSRGLGLELAREFGRRGFQIAFCARDAREVAVAQEDLTACGIDAAGFTADITSQAEVNTVIERARERFGTIWALVNNAGVIAVGPERAMTLDDYRTALDTHFWGAMYAANAVLPQMRTAKSGRIVNVVSVGGRISVPHLLPYSVSKFALLGYSEGLRAEVRADGVLVTTVVPGLMRTGSPENAEFKSRHRLEYAWFSLLDSLPFLSVDVTEAATLIADATERGTPEITISIPAKVASIVHGVLPGFVTEVLGFVTPLLPALGGIGRVAAKGSESHSTLAPSRLTEATQVRAVTQNEVPV